MAISGDSAVVLMNGNVYIFHRLTWQDSGSPTRLLKDILSVIE